MMDEKHQQIGPESAAPRHIPQHDRSPRMPAPDLDTPVRPLCPRCSEHFADQRHRDAILSALEDVSAGDGERWLEAFLRFVSNVHRFHADVISACAPAPCCDLHNRNCEPPSELCCSECTEAAHPHHRDGSSCIAPDLSTNSPEAIAAKIERSSLGTPEAQALRAIVSDEHAARIVDRARELEHEALRSIWREAAQKGIESGIDWPRIVLALFKDLDAAEQRIALALEASSWDRPYDTRIEAIRNELQGAPVSEHAAEIDVTRRLDQIEQTALRVRPTDVGKWAIATGKPSAASAVVIAPADLYWLLAMVRATRVPSPGGSDV